jgi:pimeloyl-ACP methyl ester carboxylesterase
MRVNRWATVFLYCLVFSGWVNAADPPSPPQQAVRGPGGARVLRVAVTKSRHGEGARRYWIFRPGPTQLASYPLIVFIHGWGVTNPAVYGAWLDHLVKMGNIVVYPRYQADLSTPTADFLPNTISAIRHSITLLTQDPAQARPDLSMVAVVGHSVGGLLAANMAATARDAGLPRIKAVMSVQPGRTWNRLPRSNVRLEDLRKIPTGTLLLTVVGDRDVIAGDRDAKRIYYESKQIGARDKDFVTLVSDNRGRPALIANHLAPIAQDQSYHDSEEEPPREVSLHKLVKEKTPQRQKAPASSAGDEESPPLIHFSTSGEMTPQIDALDYYGLWKLLDALCDAAFYGRNRRVALGNTLQQRFMGFWSDGVPVKQLRVTDHP